MGEWKTIQNLYVGLIPRLSRIIYTKFYQNPLNMFSNFCFCGLRLLSSELMMYIKFCSNWLHNFLRKLKNLWISMFCGLVSQVPPTPPEEMILSNPYFAWSCFIPYLLCIPNFLWIASIIFPFANANSCWEAINMKFISVRTFCFAIA